MTEQYEEEREQQGITLGEIFRTIFSQKWLVLILTLAITLVGVLGLHLGYSSGKKTYAMSFTYTSLGGNQMSPLFTYADGSKFYSSSFINEETLTAVKKSKAKYADIDVTRILNNNAVSSTELVESLGETSTDSKDKTPVYYARKITFTIKKDYISSKKLARDFMTDVLYYPTTKFTDVEVDYNIYLNEEDFNEMLTYGEQINALQSQVDYISSHYNSLPEVVVEGGVLTSAYRQNFNSWVARQDLTALRTEATANYYLKDWKMSIEKYLNSIVNIRHERDDANANLQAAQKVLDDIKNSAGTGMLDPSQVTNTINTYQAQVTSLERQLATYYNYIASYYRVTNYTVDQKGYNFDDALQFLTAADGSKIEIAEHIANTEIYAQKIKNIYNELIVGTEATGGTSYVAKYAECNNLIQPINAKNYILSPMFSTGGGMSLLIEIAISVVAGLVVAFIAAFIVGRAKLNKKAKEQANSAQPQPAAAQPEEVNESGGALAEAAATEDKTE